MGDHGPPLGHQTVVATKDPTNHWNGRLWEDANGFLLLAGARISVSAMSN